jgi:hypothetical protein
MPAATSFSSAIKSSLRSIFPAVVRTACLLKKASSHGLSMQISRRYGRSEAWSSHVQLVMSKEKKENDVNQDFGREHEHPHGQSLPHAPLPSANPGREKRQGKSGQSNFIPGEAPVGWPGRTKPFKKPGK